MKKLIMMAVLAATTTSCYQFTTMRIGPIAGKGGSVTLGFEIVPNLDPDMEITDYNSSEM
jgi:hypothetical protein